MILDNVNRKLEIILAAAKTTTDCDYTIRATGGGNPVAGMGTTNGNTAVTALAAPPALVVYSIDYVAINNVDTVNTTVTVRVNDNGTSRIQTKQTIVPGDSLCFTPLRGWYTANSQNTGANSLTETTTNAITAFAGGGQGSAVALTTAINRVTTVGTAADSVKLPASTAGATVTVINAAASNSMNIFPVTGESINALSANTAIACAANKTMIFKCAVAGTWNSVLTA